MKKLLALLLSLVLVFGFAGCSKPAAQPVTPVVEGWYTEGEITITQSEVSAIVNGQFKTPKNVIIIIGDGMGPNDITLAEQYAKGVYDFGLVLNEIPNHGLCTTYSANAEVTDSAASATALATGIKTNNSYIGKDISGNDIKNISEIAREKGKKVGIITDEALSGATPAGFVVHNINRDNRKELINSMVKFKPDVLMCAGYNDVYAPLDEEGRKIFENEYLVAKDFTKFKEVLDTDKENTKPFFGFLNRYSSNPSYNLAQCAEVAFKRLNNENGFFLMIESSGTDKYGHDKHVNGKLNSVVTLDRTVAAALKFMKDNPDTLLIVTSDHETGGIKLPATKEEGTKNIYTTDYHTGVPVRVFAVGKGSEYFKGKTVDNTDIAKFLIAAVKGE